MHVALFSDCYRPRINGVVTSLVSLKSSLETLGHRVTLVCPSYVGEDDRAEAGLVRLSAFSFPNWPEDRAALPWPPAQLRDLLRGDFQVVHVHTPFNVGVLGWWVAAHLRRPMVFTHHTKWDEYCHYLPLVSNRVGRWLAHGICNYFFSRASAIVAPSHALAEGSELAPFRSRVRVVPTGVDVELFEGGQAQRVYAELGVDAHTPLFLYVGRLAREKSIDFLLRAFRQVVQQEPQARFLIVGGGPELPTLKSLVEELGIGSQVLFLGYRARHDLKHYLAAARLFVFASQTETQGLVILEAAAAGLPVLAIRATGVNEAVHDGLTGILCEPGDLPSFVKRMLEFALRPESRSLYQHAAREWASQFSSQASGKQMIEVYQALQ